MTDFIVQSLDIENFKGIQALHLELSSGMTSVYGDNATGKTTVYDALTWLLFGKDSVGSTRFTVKPAGRKGLTPTVTAHCLVNGQVRKLRKVLRERWAKPRGGAVAQYEGDTVDYTVDDVPYQERAYKQLIAELVDEERFRLLTGVHYFARELPWRARRRLLAEMCELPDDAAILTRAPQFAPLAQAVGARTVEEYKTVLLAARKGANKTLDSLPIRMDECERLVSALTVTDYEAAQAEQEALAVRCRAVQAELARLDGDALLTEAQAARATLLAEYQALEAENTAHRAGQRVPVRDERPALQAELLQLETAIDNIREEISRAQTTIEQGQLRLAGLQGLDAVCEPVMDRCPTCGQPLPPEQLSEARARLEADRQRRMDALAKDRAFFEQTVKQGEETVREQRTALAQKTAARDACAVRLAAYQPPEQPAVFDLPDYQTRKCALDLRLAAVGDRIAALASGQAQEKQRLTEQLIALEAQRTKAEQVLSGKVHLEEARARLRTLAAEQQECAERLREIDKNIALCEDFDRYKVQFLTDAVNCRFQLARFRLFHEQVNGGLADCCDVMVDDVPYQDLNHAMQVNVGIDIIRSLSAHYGLRVPLVVDNAESVTALQSIPTQVIRLVVSASDHKLRVEND